MHRPAARRPHLGPGVQAQRSVHLCRPAAIVRGREGPGASSTQIQPQDQQHRPDGRAGDRHPAGWDRGCQSLRRALRHLAPASRLGEVTATRHHGDESSRRFHRGRLRASAASCAVRNASGSTGPMLPVELSVPVIVALLIFIDLQRQVRPLDIGGALQRCHQCRLLRRCRVTMACKPGPHQADQAARRLHRPGLDPAPGRAGEGKFRPVPPPPAGGRGLDVITWNSVPPARTMRLAGGTFQRGQRRGLGPEELAGSVRRIIRAGGAPTGIAGGVVGNRARDPARCSRHAPAGSAWVWSGGGTCPGGRRGLRHDNRRRHAVQQGVQGDRGSKAEKLRITTHHVGLKTSGLNTTRSKNKSQCNCRLLGAQLI